MGVGRLRDELIAETTCGQESLSFGNLKDTTHLRPLTLGTPPLGLKGRWWVVTDAREQFFLMASE